MSTDKPFEFVIRNSNLKLVDRQIQFEENLRIETFMLVNINPNSADINMRL